MKKTRKTPSNEAFPTQSEANRRDGSPGLGARKSRGSRRLSSSSSWFGGGRVSKEVGHFEILVKMYANAVANAHIFGFMKLFINSRLVFFIVSVQSMTLICFQVETSQYYSFATFCDCISDVSYSPKDRVNLEFLVS